MPMLRRGTKSRPNIKQPKFYDTEYPPNSPSPTPAPHTLPPADPDDRYSPDPQAPMGTIKVEPIDVYETEPIFGIPMDAESETDRDPFRSMDNDENDNDNDNDDTNNKDDDDDNNIDAETEENDGETEETDNNAAVEGERDVESGALRGDSLETDGEGDEGGDEDGVGEDVEVVAKGRGKKNGGGAKAGLEPPE